MAEFARVEPHIYQQFNGLTDAKHRAIPLLEAAGLVVESAEACDPHLGEMLNRLEAPPARRPAHRSCAPRARRGSREPSHRRRPRGVHCGVIGYGFVVASTPRG